MANNNNNILSPLVQNIQAELQSDRQLQGIEISSSIQQPQQIQSDITNHGQLQIVFNPPRGEINAELNSVTLDSSISTKQNSLQVEFTPAVINIESNLAAQVIHAFSPTVDIQATQNGYLFTVTDKRGTTTALIPIVNQENINNFINNYFENNVDIQELLETHNESQQAHQYIQQLIFDAIINFEDLLDDLDADLRQLIDSKVTDLENLIEDKVTNLDSESVVTALIHADVADFNSMTADTAFIRTILTVGEAGITQITEDTIATSMISADQIDTNSLTAQSAFMQYLEAHLVTTGEIQVDDLKAKLANISVAEIDTLSTNHAFINSLQALSSTTATSVINDAYIYNAVAGKIAVADLLAGDITISDQMRILSENGKMVMNGSALQIMGTDTQGNNYVGVQLGYATNGQPSLVLRNEDGSIIVDPSGITQDAIADGLIINDMIHTGTISEDKLGFQVMKQGDEISIQQIYTGNGYFGAEWTTFKNGTNSALDDLRQDIEDVANYDLYIETPNGTNIWGGNIQLNVRLFKNNVDVTDQFDASCFTWTRTSRDHDADMYWNSNHAVGAKIITITGNDVRMNADFQCKFEYGNVTVVAD